uniref:NADH dehydrogenase subunit 6 n=1 Tax=Odontoglaja guamensis TaxID=259595 RepID=E6Y1A7_9GAST|nr:NADH dehydrogenase subunit 6 [Odontoglaja guamensis]
MKLLGFFAFLFMLSFPNYSSPVSMGATLIMLSASMVMIMAVSASWWYSYILFLVYIGGLLVLFMYVCMISSNFSFSSSEDMAILVIASALLSYFISVKPMYKSFSGGKLFNVALELVTNSTLWLFCGVVLFLLISLLVVVRCLGISSISIS